MKTYRVESFVTVCETWFVDADSKEEAGEIFDIAGTKVESDLVNVDGFTVEEIQ